MRIGQTMHRTVDPDPRPAEGLPVGYPLDKQKYKEELFASGWRIQKNCLSYSKMPANIHPDPFSSIAEEHPLTSIECHARPHAHPTISTGFLIACNDRTKVL